MQEVSKLPAYDALRELIESAGGEMVWKPGGLTGGGTWKLTLHHKTFSVEVRDNSPNLLDWLHLPTVAEPATWNDFGDLTDDAFWRLIGLFLYRGTAT
jgi:hypothetical protein